MDFFEAEHRAKKRTARLMVLFGFAVAGTVIATYALAALGLRAASGVPHRGHRYYEDQAETAPVPLWQPQLAAWVSLGTLAVIGIASTYKWSQMSMGGGAVAESVGGRRVDPHSTDPRERQLLNVVEEMAIASGLAVPAVYVIDGEPGINAFAAGLTTSDAAVTVTRGTLEKLTRDELQGVIGHEFSHILNGDMRLNMKVSAIIFGILVLGIIGRGILSNVRLGGRRNSGGAVAVILGSGLALMIVGYAGYFFGKLIQASVSRQREFLADASSVQFTRNPAGITGALKKIGGYAIGSKLDTNRAAEIGHFFFAEAQAPHVFGSLDTHPPLAERIRAIEPTFDGKFPQPPDVVEVGMRPRASAPNPPRQAPAPSPAAGAAFGAALAAAAGTLTPEATDGARSLIAGLPQVLVNAARSPHDAAILVYGLLLDAGEPVRSRQLSAIASRHGGADLHSLESLSGALLGLRSDQRLPLLQLAMPALRAMPAASLGAFADTLDDLVQADGRVTPFEYALQRMVLRELAVSKDPKAGVAQIFSFQAVAAEISVVLSALAHASSSDPAAAARAFAEGAGQLKLVQERLQMTDDAHSGLVQLDQALERLAVASGPIKQRVLVAAAHVVGADGVVLEEEAELLRAVAAALNVPVPPVSSLAA